MLKKILSYSLFFVLATTAFAQENMSELDEAFRSLRNRDPEIHFPKRWFDLSDRYQFAAKKNSIQSEQALALFRAAFLYEQLARKSVKPDPAKDAEALYLEIVQQYPGTDIAADSLMNLADFYVQYLNNQQAAAKLYYELYQNYPNSVLRQKAELRLAEIFNTKQKARVENENSPLVIIDPGHGGDDNGAIANNLVEKDIVLDLAMLLKRELENRGVRVRLTRTDDRFIPLAARSLYATDYAADLFISLHINAAKFDNKKIIEIYTANQDRKAAEKLRENQGFNQDINWNVAIDAAGSAKFSDDLKNSLAKHTKDFEIDEVNQKKAAFYVLLGLKMPAVLLELLYIDDSDSQRLLKQGNFRTVMAQAIAEGIINFLN